MYTEMKKRMEKRQLWYFFSRFDV